MATSGPHAAENHGQAGTPLVRTVACLGGVSLERGVSAEEVLEYILEAGNLVWMDVQDPGPEELSLLLEEFGFHPLALEDVAKGRQRPKVDEYRGYLFMVTYGVLPAEDLNDWTTVELDLFIGRNYLVTIHRGRLPALEEAQSRWTRGGGLLREGVGFLVYTVMDAVIDAYFPLIDRVEDQAVQVELNLLTQGRSDTLELLLQLKRTLVSLRRVLQPLREAFHVFLRRDHPFFSANTLVYFQDVYDHILRILDALEMERELVAGALEAQLAVISNRLNATMKTLTVITICVAICGSVFGAWGMNFSRLPWADSPWGFWLVAGGSLGLSAVALAVSRRLGWL